MEGERVSLLIRTGLKVIETDMVVSVTGTLKGYDQLMNLVLDNVKEITRGEWQTLSLETFELVLMLKQTKRETSAPVLWACWLREGRYWF